MTLKELRKRKGLSQSRLAQLSGVNIRMLQDYEQKRYNVSNAKAITVYKIAKALDSTVEDIIDGDCE